MIYVSILSLHKLFYAFLFGWNIYENGDKLLLKTTKTVASLHPKNPLHWMQTYKITRLAASFIHLVVAFLFFFLTV